jgi:hypothetical protein
LLFISLSPSTSPQSAAVFLSASNIPFAKQTEQATSRCTVRSYMCTALLCGPVRSGPFVTLHYGSRCLQFSLQLL